MQSSHKLYVRLLSHVRPHWKGFVLTLAATVIAAATEPLFPALMKPLLDKGFSPQGERWLLWMPLAIVGIFVLRGIAGFLANYGMAWVSNRVVTDLRQAMFGRLIELPVAYFDTHSSSEPITRIANDVNGVGSASTTVLTVLFRDTLTVLGLLAWLLFLNWKLTLLSLLSMPLIGLFTRLLSLRLRKLALGAQEQQSRLIRALNESIRGQKVIKIFGGEEDTVARFRSLNNTIRGYGMRQAVGAAIIVPVTQILASFGLALVVYVALQQSQDSQMTVGDFVSFITAMLLLLAPLKHLADINGPLQRGLAAAESIFRLLDEPPETSSGQIVVDKMHGAIEFDHVTLRYEGSDRDALTKVSLKVSAGETIAIVGPSGGGKSSLVSLLPRFYHPAEGRVEIDGVDIQTIATRSLRANIGFVGQDVFLFDDTVAFNIAYGATGNATQEQIRNAAKAANALEFIERLPEGFNTSVGENGNRLSGGQRQRIAIARAILKNAPILILDEATSALDNESERLVQEALDFLMQNRTTLVIAHRLSTIQKSDRIVVLDSGVLVESGTHSSLLALGGTYSKLHGLMLAGYQH